MDLTESFVNFILKEKFDSLPSKVVEHVKYCILDWLGAAFAGAREPSSRIVIQLVKNMGGRGESSIIGEVVKVPCLNAALANGVIGHGIELDDVHEKAIIHPAAPVVPAALAVAEKIGASGKDLITAVAVGYETEIRLGRAMNPSHYDFWHPTGTCGTFGATGAAGKLLDLHEVSMAHAFGIAGTEAAGLVEVFGTMSKPFNAGRSARDGVMAAMLAKNGFTSSTSIFDAEKGYLRATTSELKLEGLTEGLGNDYETTNTIFKRHASCGHTHGAIDAVLEIVEQNDLHSGDISEISIGTYPISVETVGRNYDPKTVAEAKFSLPYCVAMAVIQRKVSIDEFSKENLGDPEIIDLMKLVKVYVAPEYVDALLGCAKVTLLTNKGEEYTKFVETPKGYPKNPLTKKELEQKFKTLSSLILSKDKGIELVEAVKSLEKVENIQNLSTLLRG